MKPLDYHTVVVDLDYVFLKENTLEKIFDQLVHTNRLNRLPIALNRALGMRHSRKFASRHCNVGDLAGRLTVNDWIYRYIVSQKKNGARIVMLSEQHEDLVCSILRELKHDDLFDDIYASDDKNAVDTDEKIRIIRDKLYDKERVVVYCGARFEDLKIWSCDWVRSAVTTGEHSHELRQLVESLGNCVFYHEY
ncbi:MAG: hypothetical protein ACI4UM_06795 [Succinivibrio sp.]